MTLTPGASTLRARIKFFSNEAVKSSYESSLGTSL